MPSPFRLFRAPLVGLAAAVVGLGLVGCGKSSPASTAEATSATGPFAAVFVSVCASAKAADDGNEPAADRAFEDAHGRLHELAAAAEAKDRSAAARLLEAKQAVESKATGEDRRQLVIAVSAAIDATGGSAPSSCP